MTPAERAQRDADKVYHWILIHTDKPRKPVAAPRDDKPSVAATVRVKSTARAEPAPANPVPASTVPQPPSTEQRAVAAQPPSTPTGAAPSAGVATAPVLTAAARPGAADSLSVPVSSPGPLQTSTPAPAAVAAEALDETLTPILRAAPQFPQNLLRTLRKGQVQVRFTVLPDGSVAEPEVLSTSNARLNQAALTAVLQWRFVPLQRAQSARVDLGFDLD